MKIKDLIEELMTYDDDLEVEVYKKYRTKRFDKFEIKEIVPCIKKEHDENGKTVKAVIII